MKTIEISEEFANKACLQSSDIIELIEDNKAEYLEIKYIDGNHKVYMLAPSPNCYGSESCEPDEKCDCKILMQLSQKGKELAGFKDGY